MIPNYKFALREDLKDDKRFLPTRAEAKASGWDVRAAFKENSIIIQPFEYIKIPLGFRSFCPEGWWFELKPRSSSFAKKNLHALYGTIDNTFEGEGIFAAQYIPDPNAKLNPTLIIEFGEAIGQILPIKLQDMTIEDVSNIEYEELCSKRKGMRGSGGFGSTSQ